MTIEIHQPELEALIQQRMASGDFCDLDELLTQALNSMQEPPVSKESAPNGQTLFELAAPIRGLFTDNEIDAMFRRDPSPGRAVDIS